ncbi:MAG: hypothetical protein IH908_11885, partial [Proteobacteria bacterium]|nr:hypothetical protein [Pseudomonadota bacterium]
MNLFLQDQAPTDRKCIVLPLNPGRPAKSGQLVGEAKTIDGEPLYVVEYENGLRVRARTAEVEFLIEAERPVQSDEEWKVSDNDAKSLVERAQEIANTDSVNH